MDVVFATSTPLTVGVPGTLAKYLRRTPFVFEVRDIWPESAVEAGALTNPLLIFLSNVAARRFYRAADRIVAISHRMAERLRGTRPRCAEGLRHSARERLARFDRAAADADWRRRSGLEGKYVAMFTGPTAA